MNFAGHAAVAARCSADAEGVLGAVLPDLAAILHVPLRRPNDDLDPGIALHYAADSAFHASGWFVTRMKTASLAMQAEGVERGPARAAAHVGVELLLDGALLNNGANGSFDDVWQRLSAPDRLVRDAVLDEHRDDWLDRLDQFTSALDPWRYGDPTYAAARIVGMLEHRPRLRLPRTQAGVVSDVLGDLAGDIAASATEIVAEVARRCGSDFGGGGADGIPIVGR